MTTHRTDIADAELHPTGWLELPELGIEVTLVPVVDTKHALPSGAQLFARLTHKDAKAFAADLGGIVVRGETLAALKALPDVVVIEPNSQPHTQSLAGSERHDAEVWDDLHHAGWDGCGPVLGIGKHHRDGAPEGRAYLGGWWTESLGAYSQTRTGPGWVQRIDTEGDGPHGDGIFDYATLTLVQRPLRHDTDPPDTLPAPVSSTPATDPAPTTIDDDPAPDTWRSPLKRGMRGDDVAAWQAVLIGDGYDLGRAADDGKFGKLSHNATVSWQGERVDPKDGSRLDKDGKVGPATRRAIGNDPIERLIITPAEWSFRQAKHFRPANRTELHWGVVHTSEAIEASTTAEALQSYGATIPSNRIASWHAAGDDDSIALSVKESDVAFHCPGLNRFGYGFELSGFARQSEAQWRDPFSTRMLELLAGHFAGLFNRWDIPTQFIQAAKLDAAHQLIKRGDKVPNELRGVTTHNQGRRSRISRGRTTHTDPGKVFERVMMPELIDRIAELR